jgi:nuclear pore complex protein Nup210
MDNSLIWITAKDKITGDVLRCETKVGRIHSLQILTNMRSIDVDDINILEVQAFDEEGNVFSTVEGMKFQWRIEENTQSLRKIPIKEAHFKTTKKKHEMERKSFSTDIVLLKGLKTGKSRVSVQLIEDGYQSVSKAEIWLSVIEPFTLDPNHPIYIMPNSEFQYGILRIKAEQKYSRVSLPSDEFIFFSDNEQKGRIFNDGVFKSYDQIGNVTVTAQDVAIDSNKAQGLVYIVPPDQLEVELYDVTHRVSEIGVDDYAERIYGSYSDQELNSVKKENLMIELHQNTWILVEERYYLVNMFLFDEAKHRIELTENLVFDFSLNTEFIDVFDVNRVSSSNSQKSNLYLIKAKKVIQRTSAVGTLTEVATNDELVYPFNFDRLVVERGVQITSQVGIIHPTPEIRLPYLGYHKQPNKGIEKQLWSLPAIGGTGTYTWSSADERVTLVKNSKISREIGEVRGNNEGQTTIKVQDSLNPFNFATITVHVTKIGSLTWLEEKIESESGGTADYIHLIAYDEFGRKYTNCSDLVYNLSTKKEDENIVALNKGHMTWNSTKAYIKDEIELFKLKNRFDEQHDVIYKDDLSSRSDFNTELQIHNNFGICGSDLYRTKEEGLARVKASLPINHDTAKYSRPVESDFAQIASYSMPTTESPSYKDMFTDLRYPKEPIQHSKLFKSYYNENVFKISYGSSLVWVYNGGTNYWAEDGYQLQHTLAKNTDGLDVQCLSEILPPLANRVTYQFTCENSGVKDVKEFNVAVSMENRVTRSLLRPQKNVAKISVHCAVPKSVDLWWAQADKLHKNSYKNLPEYVLENNEKTYYLRNDQSRFMRALVFDQDKQILFNTTSLNIDFSADVQNKLDFENYGRNDKVIAHFKKESGVVYAQVDVEESISNNKKIKLIEKVKLNPALQTRYLHNDNIAELYITDGSGSFRVKSNTTSIASLNHFADINTIKMNPLDEGAVEVVIEDLGVETLETASAELLVSDIYRIELTGGGLIEQGNKMNLTIEVFDSQNRKFDKSQLKYMDIKPEIEKIGSSRREGLEVERINDDTFTVTGIQSGNYRTTVVACKKRNTNDRISSNYVRIEVFDIVKLVPDSILLFPGARWTIQVEGGPSGGSRGSVYRDYEVEDDHICEIDEYGEVYGKHVGETWLSLNLYYKSNNQRTLLASRKIKIRVALVTSIEIPMMNERSVFVNSLTRLNVKLKHNKETFLHAIGPLSFEWHTSSSHVYDLSVPSRKDSKGGGSSANLVQKKSDIWNGETGQIEEFATNFNYSSILGIANKNGDARITVKMAIEYPEEYKKEKNYFQHHVRVKVTDKLTMQVPEFIEYPTKEPHLYVLPPLAKNRITTNKDTKVKLAYSIQTGIHYDRGYDCRGEGDDVLLVTPEEHNEQLDESPILKIHKDGYVETLDKYGKATVVIEENQSMENQIVMLNIMVTQIYSLSIEKPYTALNLPMGSETNLKITYQEENARSFASEIEGVDLFIQNSHPHIVSATLDAYNSTLNLNALGIGEANIKIYTKDNIFDVIRVKVMSSVLPHSPVQLHVGGTVQFVFAEKESNINAKWSTNDHTILKIDQAYGKAEALREGTAQAIYEGNVNLVSLVDVKKVERIELDPHSRPEFFTNARSNKFYKDEHHLLLNVFLEDGLSEILPETLINGKPLIKQNIKITCETPDTSFAVAFSKQISNRYACILRPIPDSTPSGKIPNTIRLTVRATSPQSHSYKTEETFEIPFVSFFKISHPSKNINFYADERFKSLEVISNTDFSVDIEGNSDLVNYKIEEKDVENHYEIQFSVPSSVSQEFKDLRVKISNALTDSSETYFLSYYKDPRSSYSTGSHQTTTTTTTTQREEPVHHPHVEPGEKSQIAQIIIIFTVICGIVVGLVYYCCGTSGNSLNYDESSFMSSDSKDKYGFSRSPNKSGRKSQAFRTMYKQHYKN